MSPVIRPRRPRVPVPFACLTLALIPALPVSLVAQDTEPVERAAQRGAEVTDSLSAGAVHAFLIDLAADHFVRGTVDQQSVDVVVSILGPEGERVARFDGPAEGDELFVFNAEEPGTYRVEVSPFEEDAGRYTFHLPVVEPIASEPAARVDQLMAVFDEPGNPGAVVGVVERGELVFARGYGLANLAHEIPYGRTTRTNIGSTSKQFTAFAIQLLADRGKLSLDDDVRTHLPDVKDFGEPITIRHLLTHTSGYREFLNLLAMGGRRLDYDYVDRAELVEILARQPALQNAPGAEWNYNNTAFGLAADIVAEVGGAPFPEWMRENVFLPLGMENTMVRTDPRTIVPDGALGYVVDKGGYKEASDLGGAMGAGGIYTTIEDLARWMSNYFDPRLGDEGMIREMTTPFTLTDGESTEYGLGLFVDEFRGLRRVHHGGADVAHRSSFFMFPEIDSGYMVLSNLASFPGSLATEVAEAFFSDHFEDEDATDAVAENGEASDAAEFTAETFDAYEGRYAMDQMPSFVLTFRRDGDTYYTQATGQPELEIEPVSDSTFRLLAVDARVTFHREEDGSVERITLHQNGEHAATRVKDDPRSAEELAAYAGRYYSPELEAYWTIEVREDALVATHRRMDDVPLTPGPKGEDSFGGTFPFATIDFERGSDGAVTGFRAGNGRTRDVRFERVQATGN